MQSQRRTTLGPVTSGSLNSRNSFGPSRIPASSVKKNDNLQNTNPNIMNSNNTRRMTITATNAKVSMGSNRLSTNSRGNYRESSMYGKAGPKIITDPRQISDKGYMIGSMNKVIKYVTSKGYNNPISTQVLTNPTSKNFMSLMEFLYLQFDPSFSWTKKKEEEIPELFKRLKYPFPISKSALYAIGSPHAWPSLLAALTWMVDLLIYLDRCNDNKSLQGELDSDDNNGAKYFFGYLTRSYELYMNGKDAEDAALWTEMDKNHNAKIQEIQGNINLLTKANEDLKQELQNIISQPSPIVELENKKKIVTRRY